MGKQPKNKYKGTKERQSFMRRVPVFSKTNKQINKYLS